MCSTSLNVCIAQITPIPVESLHVIICNALTECQIMTRAVEIIQIVSCLNRFFEISAVLWRGGNYEWGRLGNTLMELLVIFNIDDSKELPNYLKFLAREQNKKLISEEYSKCNIHYSLILLNINHVMIIIFYENTTLARFNFCLYDDNKLVEQFH